MLDVFSQRELKSRGFKTIFCIVTAVFIFGCGADAPGKKSTSQAPERAAPFSVKTLDGGKFSLANANGAPVVVNFWASWCPPCVEEAPALERVYKKYKPSGVEFIGLAVDDTKKDAAAFIRRFNLSFPMALDERGDIMRAYNAIGLPQTYLVDAQGHIVYKHLGTIDEAALAAEITRLVGPSGARSASFKKNDAADGEPVKGAARL